MIESPMAVTSWPAGGGAVVVVEAVPAPVRDVVGVPTSPVVTGHGNDARDL